MGVSFDCVGQDFSHMDMQMLCDCLEKHIISIITS